jgi:hypothetical protein
MEENYEVESEKISIYGNISINEYNKQQMFDCLVNKYEE